MVVESSRRLTGIGTNCREGETPSSCGNFSDTTALQASLSNRLHSTKRSLSSVYRYRAWVRMQQIKAADGRKGVVYRSLALGNFSMRSENFTAVTVYCSRQVSRWVLSFQNALHGQQVSPEIWYTPTRIHGIIIKKMVKRKESCYEWEESLRGCLAQWKSEERTHKF